MRRLPAKGSSAICTAAVQRHIKSWCRWASPRLGPALITGKIAGLSRTRLNLCPLLPHRPNFCAFARLREPSALSVAVLNGPCERTAEILAYLVK